MCLEKQGHFFFNCLRYSPGWPQTCYVLRVILTPDPQSLLPNCREYRCVVPHQLFV